MFVLRSSIHIIALTYGNVRNLFGCRLKQLADICNDKRTWVTFVRNLSFRFSGAFFTVQICLVDFTSWCTCLKIWGWCLEWWFVDYMTNELVIGVKIFKFKNVLRPWLRMDSDEQDVSQIIVDQDFGVDKMLQSKRRSLRTISTSPSRWFRSDRIDAVLTQPTLLILGHEFA